MLFRKKGLEIFVYSKPIDMRWGFDRLTGLAKRNFRMEKILDGHVFLFLGKNRRRAKLLFFDGTGLILLVKRLEEGRFMWVEDIEVERIDFRELEQLLHGSFIKRARLGTMPR